MEFFVSTLFFILFCFDNDCMHRLNSEERKKSEMLIQNVEKNLWILSLETHNCNT